MRVALLAVSLIMLSSVFPLVWARAEPKVLKVYSSFDDGSLEPGTLSYAINYIHKFPGRYVIVFESDLIVNASSNKVLYLNPIRSFVEIEFRGNGHKIRVYDFFKSKPSGCTLDKVVLRVNTVIPASMGSVVKVSNLEIIIDTNETDGYTSFISPLNIVAPVVILENITIRGRILGGDFYDNFAAIYTFGGENFFRNILADIYTSVPSSPHDFNANFFLDTPKTVFMENITSLLVANGRVVGVYVGTPAKWGAEKVELVNVSSIIRVEQGYYTFGVWIRNAGTAVAHVKVDVISNTPTVFGFVLTKIMQTVGEGFEVDSKGYWSRLCGRCKNRA